MGDFNSELQLYKGIFKVVQGNDLWTVDPTTDAVGKCRMTATPEILTNWSMRKSQIKSHGNHKDLTTCFNCFPETCCVDKIRGVPPDVWHLWHVEHIYKKMQEQLSKVFHSRKTSNFECVKSNNNLFWSCELRNTSSVTRRTSMAPDSCTQPHRYKSK